MARYLFVVPPFVGHINPTISVAHELQAKGHTVAWVGHPGAVRPLLPEGATLFELAEHDSPEGWAQLSERRRRTRGFEALKLLYEDVIAPLAGTMLPGVEAAARELGADVLVVDQQALAGALAARRVGLRWATLSTTSATVINPLALVPRVNAWRAELFAKLERSVGLDPRPEPDCSPDLVIAFTTSELMGNASLPAHYHLVGPSFHKRRETTPFPWDTLVGEQRVLVSLGTANPDVGERFYATVFEAFAEHRKEELQIVLVAPEPWCSRPAPENVLVRPFVPQVALLQHVHAVVCHAGHNTTCEALAHGLPLVVLPIKDDQTVVAQQVADAGAGIRLRFARVRPAELREAVVRVLAAPSFQEAAARIRRSFTTAGGATRAAELLEALAP